jgi:hypothetical protein
MSLESSIREAALNGAREAFQLEARGFLDQFHGVFIRVVCHDARGEQPVLVVS